MTAAFGAVPGAKFGVALYLRADAPAIVRMARLAEELGFDSVWLADSHMIFREVYATLGAVAATTARIEIGPGVTHPVGRHPSVTASAVATLAELAPGRVNLGLGIGSSGPRNIGSSPTSLKQLEDTLQFIRDLLACKEAEQDGKRMRLTFATGAPLPIYVAAASDRTHRMSGRLADGAIIAGPPDSLRASIAAIREGESAAGRPAGTVKTVLMTPCCVNEDEQVARGAVRPMVARTAMVWLERAARLGTIDPADREPLARLQQGYDFYHHLGPEYGHLVEERWIDRFSMAGASRRLLRQCEEVFAAGADQVLLAFQGPDPELQMERFAEGVIAPLRKRAAPSPLSSSPSGEREG